MIGLMEANEGDVCFAHVRVIAYFTCVQMLDDIVGVSKSRWHQVFMDHRLGMFSGQSFREFIQDKYKFDDVNDSFADEADKILDIWDNMQLGKIVFIDQDLPAVKICDQIKIQRNVDLSQNVTLALNLLYYTVNTMVPLINTSLDIQFRNKMDRSYIDLTGTYCNSMTTYYAGLFVLEHHAGSLGYWFDVMGQIERGETLYHGEKIVWTADMILRATCVLYDVFDYATRIWTAIKEILSRHRSTIVVYVPDRMYDDVRSCQWYDPCGMQFSVNRGYNSVTKAVVSLSTRYHRVILSTVKKRKSKFLI